MIRSTLKAGIRRLFGVEVKPAPSAPVPPAWRAAPVAKVEPAAVAPVKPAEVVPVVVAAPVEVAPVAVAAPVGVTPIETPVIATIVDVAPVETAVAAAPVDVAPVEAAAPVKKSKKKAAKTATAPVEAAHAAAVEARVPEAVASPEPVAAAAEPAVAATPEAKSAEPATDTVGPPAFNMDQVQELFDEMVRPALQGDGGDIKLVKIENNDIYVRLVGSCQSCPSSVLTMKMGVEALLKEELPGFGSLIQVD